MSATKIYSKLQRSYRPGDLIFYEGDPWDGVYCIQSGKVSIFKTQGDKTVELAQLGQGALIGELGLFGKSRRDASVKALERTEILVISLQMFEEQMNRVPPWMVNLFKILSQRLRTTNEKLVETTRRLEVLSGTKVSLEKDSDNPLAVPPNPLV